MDKSIIITATDHKSQKTIIQWPNKKLIRNTLLISLIVSSFFFIHPLYVGVAILAIGLIRYFWQINSDIGDLDFIGTNNSLSLRDIINDMERIDE